MISIKFIAGILMILAVNIFPGGNNPVITFNELTYDFSDVAQGVEPGHIFKFTNSEPKYLFIIMFAD